MNTERIKQAMAQLATLNAKIASNSTCNAFSEENHKNAIEIVLEALQSFLELGITPEQMREIDMLYAEKCMELEEKVAFDFDRAINALKENQEHKKLGTLEEVRESVEKQREKKPTYDGDGYAPDGTFIWDEWICPHCRSKYEVDYDDYNYCPNCGQHIDWSDENE